MPLQTIVLATLVTGFGLAQYILAVHAIRDLFRRPRVRGGNKVSWGLAILCLPIAGALIYSWMGPASFIRRASIAAGESFAPSSAAAPMGVPSPERRGPSSPGPGPNVTPITSRRPAVTTERPPAPSAAPPPGVRRTGS